MEAAADGFETRLSRLRASLAERDGLAVAFSGGVDSTVLLHAAHATLGPRAAGLIADSPSLPRAELAAARDAAAAIGARLEVLATRELEDPRYAANAGDRCYWCKSALFDAMASWARAHGFRQLAYGAVTDDLGDFRPGARAAAERGVCAPLLEAGFSKADVRRYARRHGLAAAEKPASACLASRVPLGTTVTAERLAEVEAAEAGLHALGFRVVRVRHHGRRARIELGADELARAGGIDGEIARALERAGFAEHELAAYVAPAERARPA